MNAPVMMISYVWSIAGQEEFACTSFSAASDSDAIRDAKDMARDSIRELERTEAEIQVRRMCSERPFFVGTVELEPVHPGEPVVKSRARGARS